MPLLTGGSTGTHPEQFSTEVVISTSDGLGKIGIDFGFDANQIIVLNDKASPVYMSLNSTSGSTGGHQIKAGESRSFSQMLLGRMSFASTSTSSGDVVRVAAWRYA